MNSQFLATRQAFDRVAAAYDGPLGNNAIIQKMRAQVMQIIEHTFPRGARLLDLGCGTGIDAAYLTSRSYDVTGLDVSPAMVARANERLERSGNGGRAMTLGIHELERLESGGFDGAYSNFGALNCLPELRTVSSALAAKLKPGGRLVAVVMGRYCPWEFGLYTLRGNWQRARLRLEPGVLPVPLNGEIVWTRYYTPREFSREFAAEFVPEDWRSLALLTPPPYLVHQYEKFPRLFDLLDRADYILRDKPFFREAGDHFVMVLRKK